MGVRVPPRAPSLMKRRPAGINLRGASFSPHRSEGGREPLRVALPLGVRMREGASRPAHLRRSRKLAWPKAMQEGASRPAYSREAHFGMAEGNAGKSFATCLPTRSALWHGRSQSHSPPRGWRALVKDRRVRIPGCFRDAKAACPKELHTKPRRAVIEEGLRESILTVDPNPPGKTGISA